ncbi:ribosomal RNA processing protein 1 homolog A isoform X2 [Leptonychotes weddellii]|nr:ribosomal RNA processing protein 1 homolog A isoform X2 [Leptonychotes weddellii]
MVPRVPLPPEIQLAQRLAGNEQVTRDRAVKKLRKYIVARTQRAAGGFTHDELLKVWKGLFYCMWMQDKPLLQEELGRTISQLIHAFQTTEAQHLFLQTFWQTMNREWPGIDRLRLDKFYMLMRMVLNESLKALKTQGWQERHVEQLLELLTTEILHPDSQAPSGVKSHFLEIFLEELSKVGAAELTADQNLKFIDPFCTIAARTQDSLVLHNITRGIFEAIVEQAPFAIEDLMNELDAQEEEDGMSEDDEHEQDVLSKEPGVCSSSALPPRCVAEIPCLFSCCCRHCRNCHGHLVSWFGEVLASITSGARAPASKIPSCHGCRIWKVTATAEVMPASAGCRVVTLSFPSLLEQPHGCHLTHGSSPHGAARDRSEELPGDGEDSVGPVLQFDYEAVASRLFVVASQQGTPSQNRKRLYKVIRKLQDLAEGLFPEDDVPEKAYRNLQEEGQERRTKKRPKSRSQKQPG